MNGEKCEQGGAASVKGFVECHTKPHRRGAFRGTHTFAAAAILCVCAPDELLSQPEDTAYAEIEALRTGRPLIILAAPDQDRSEYRRTVARLRSEAGESLIGEGGVIFVTLLERGVSRFESVRLSMATAVSLRGRFGVASGRNTTLLIGPDGVELMRREKAATISMFVAALQDAGLAIDDFGVDVADPEARRQADNFASAMLSLADREFSRTSLEFGAAESFNRYLGESAVELPAGGAPQLGRKVIYDSMVRAGGDYTLTWKPRKAEVSRSRDLGYTWGFYTLSWKSVSGDGSQTYGKYVNVWQKDSEGLWKVIVDIGNRGPDEIPE